MQILMNINIRHNPPAEGIIFQIVDNSVHLIHHAFFILMPDSQLIAIGFSYGTVLVRPFIPYMAVQVMDIIGFLLPYPENLVRRGFQGRTAQG